MNRFILIVIALTVFIIGSCSSHESEQKDVSVTFLVKDTNGNKIDNVNVYLYNQYWEEEVSRSYEDIYTALKKDCYLKIYILDVENHLIKSLANSTYPKGFISFIYNGLDSLGNETPEGLYYAHVRAYSLDQNSLYYDKKAVLFKSSGYNNTLGSTDNQGKFFFNDKKYFVGLYNKTIEHYSGNCDPFGTLTLSKKMHYRLRKDNKCLEGAFTYDEHSQIVINVNWDDAITENKIEHKQVKQVKNTIEEPPIVDYWNVICYPNPFN